MTLTSRGASAPDPSVYDSRTMPGEFDFIDWIRSQSRADPRIIVPIGDDLAAMKWDANDLLLVGADQVLDGVHFDSAVHAPRDIGRKAMNRNLSDCAAMACLPAAAVATVALPKGTAIEYAKELFLGMSEAGEKFNCPIIGGDTSSWKGKLALSVSILGKTTIGPVRRNGARPGDHLHVTGPLGGSLLGRHMTFEPRISFAWMMMQMVRGPYRVADLNITAMIDLSDGLSRDIRHICAQSSVGAIIFSDKIPVHDDAVEMRRDGHSPLEHALHDGEDYELLLTMAGMPTEQAARPTTTGEASLNWIGTITAEPGIFLQHSDGRREPLEPKAWEHQF